MNTEMQGKERLTLAFLLMLPMLILGGRALGDATATLCALSLLVLWVRRPALRDFHEPWFYAVLLLWGFMLVVSSPLAIEPRFAATHSLIYIRWPLFALCLCLVFFTSSERVTLFERAVLGWVLFIILDSLFQRFAGFDIFGRVSPERIRLTGPFSKEVPGIYSLRLYPIALAALVGLLRQRPKQFLPGMLAFMVLAQLFAFLAGERMVFLEFLVLNAVVAAVLVYSARPPRLLVLGGLAGLAAAAVGAAVLDPFMFQRTVVSFARQVGDFEHTSYFKIFEVGFRLWQTHPWTGIGTQYYNAACVVSPYVSGPDDCAQHPHNIYLEYLCQNGVIGLALFLVALFLLFRRIWQPLDFSADPLRSTLVILVPVAIFWPLTTSMSTLANNYAGLVWMTMAWAICQSRIQPARNA